VRTFALAAKTIPRKNIEDAAECKLIIELLAVVPPAVKRTVAASIDRRYTLASRSVVYVSRR